MPPITELAGVTLRCGNAHHTQRAHSCRSELPLWIFRHARRYTAADVPLHRRCNDLSFAVPISISIVFHNRPRDTAVIPVVINVGKVSRM